MSFHPAVAAWFERTFGAPTPAQAAAWPAVQTGRHVLVAAPTGSGKTLAAFLAAIDTLVRRAQGGPLPDATAIVYVSPLKALSNDIRRNLEAPLAGIEAELAARGQSGAGIRTLVRTGDTTAAERAGMKRRPPHIVITTPESLYVLLGSESGRKLLASTESVIVDEIHAVAGSKRGSHLALSLERLERLTGRTLQRIGLSATQKPIERVAEFLLGRHAAPDACTIVDAGHTRPRDLQIEVPPAPLEAVMSHEVWEQVYDRLAALVLEHRTTLVFVNTRRHAERVTRHLGERLGTQHVAAHHGSLAKERRFDAEQRLKAGALRVLVATASLELGIDIGDVDLVCQIGNARSIAQFLQRAGRAGHSVGGTPKARLFPLSRDELAEAVALLDAIRRGELDRLCIPPAPLDVLAQQIVAEVAGRGEDEEAWSEDALYALVTGADPYRTLERTRFDQVLAMLVEGFGTRRGQSRQYLHHDAVHRRVRARKGARLTAITSGGAIPDNADYDVVLEPANITVGTLNEDFAIESLAGDIFQLGNTSYRILRVEAGRVRVEDAQGAPPNIPFWLGEAPGRSDELSHAVSRLRDAIAARLDEDPARAIAWLVEEIGIAPAAATQLVEYYALARAALGVLPTERTIVLERFFDESGGMQLVIHSPLGSRLNRAWGLALRKRFCVKFDFELQAAATEDAIVLSLSSRHSFPLAEIARYLNAGTVREVLIQAMLAAPMFTARWRWNASIALAIPRFRGGRKVAPNLQRMLAEDLIAQVFPDQIACADNLVGDREVPDHPLVNQTVADCLNDAMDLAGLQRLLAGIANGEIAVLARDLTEPSPLALEILSARPYAFLDDAPLEERRTRAVMARRWTDVNQADDLAALDPAAIARVKSEAYPQADTVDELHDALLWFGGLSLAEANAVTEWPGLLERLAADGRATRLSAGGTLFWIAAERIPRLRAIHPAATFDPPLAAPNPAEAWTREAAIVELIRGRLEGLGPVGVAALAAPPGLSESDVTSALAALEGEGFALRGSFNPGAAAASEWCERGLLARIHRYTLNQLRREIEPVSSQDFMRFLADWQHVSASERKEGPDALAALIADLEGFEAPAAAWETEILPARLAQYDFQWLDDLCLAGRAVWMRLDRPRASDDSTRRAGPVRTTPIALMTRRNASLWSRLAARAPAGTGEPAALNARAERVHALLVEHGASFFDEITAGTGFLPVEAEEALAELVAAGRVTSDSFAGLRALLVPSDRRRTIGTLGTSRGRRKTAAFGIQDAGRWSLVRAAAESGADEALEHVARTLLRRYGVIAWRLLAREAPWLPPWRDLLRVYRRLEARGEIRGGRFIAGLSGEQFALPDAISRLREVRRRAPDGALVAASGADPLNLAGILGGGPKVPALTGNRVVYRDGVAIAALTGGSVQWLVELDPLTQNAARNALVVRPGLAAALAYLR